jgi:hypothetical protein
MALYNTAMTITYVTWDTAANTGKTGDVANHTLRWIKDGTSAAPTNAAAEVDATNAPGIYKLTLTATETQAVYGVLAGKSSTADISVMPVSISFERLPNATATANLEDMLDGTGGVQLKLKELVINQTTPTENAVTITANAAGSAGIVINATDSLGTGIILNTGLGTVDLDGSDIKTLLNTISTNVLTNGTSINTTITNTDSVESSLSTIDTGVGQLQTSLNTIAGAGFVAGTDSLESIRDRGDVGWTTGTPSSLTAADVRTEIDSNSTQLAAIKTKTDLITSSSITVTSPVNTAGDITIVRGDDIDSTLANAIVFNSTDWQDLTSSTVVFSCKHKRTGVAGLTAVATTVTNAGQATQTVTVNLTAAQTAQLSPGDDAYYYDVQATLSGGSVVTLTYGDMTVIEDVS